MNTPAELDRRIRLDPLFAAEGADIARSRAALGRIEWYVARLEYALTREGPLTLRTALLRIFFFFYPLRRSVYPLDFMSNFLWSEELRRVYLAAPSEDAARTLVTSWVRTARLFTQTAKRYRRVHRWALRLEPSARTYTLQDMFGNRSTVPYIEASLDALVENGRELERDARACLNGNIQIHARSGGHGQKLASAVAEPLYARLHELEQEGGVMPFRYWDVVESRGPFTFELDTFDGERRTHTFQWYLLARPQEGIRCVWVASLDTFLFTKIRTLEKEDGTTGKIPFVFSGGVSKQEAPYWYEPTGHLYLTRDLSYITEITALADAERRAPASGSTSQRSGLLDALWGACMDDLRIYVRHTRRRARERALGTYSLLYGLLMRTHPYLYFLAFNESVWRLAQPLTLRGTRAADENESPYEPVSSVFWQLSEEQLKTMMGAQRAREEREIKAGFGEG